jgi:hypothetical protein
MHRQLVAPVALLQGKTPLVTVSSQIGCNPQPPRSWWGTKCLPKLYPSRPLHNQLPGDISYHTNKEFTYFMSTRVGLQSYRAFGKAYTAVCSHNKTTYSILKDSLVVSYHQNKARVDVTFLNAPSLLLKYRVLKIASWTSGPESRTPTSAVFFLSYTQRCTVSLPLNTTP